MTPLLSRTRAQPCLGVFQDSRHPGQSESELLRPQMRLATSERSFNESYPRSFLRTGSDTCVNLICVGTSDEFPPEVAPDEGGRKRAREDEISSSE